MLITPASCFLMVLHFVSLCGSLTVLFTIAPYIFLDLGSFTYLQSPWRAFTSSLETSSLAATRVLSHDFFETFYWDDSVQTLFGLALSWVEIPRQGIQTLSSTQYRSQLSTGSPLIFLAAMNNYFKKKCIPRQVPLPWPCFDLNPVNLAPWF